MQREIAFHPMLGGHIQHPCDFAQDGFAIVPMLVTFYHHDPIGFVDGEIEPSEFFRAGATELNHGFAIRGVPGGLEKFEEPLLLFFPPLDAPFGMVSFEMHLQTVCRDIAGFTAFRCADVRTFVVVGHRVVSQIGPIIERLTTPRDIAMERPLAGVDSLVSNGIARIE
jgi:hypothetical protein